MENYFWNTEILSDKKKLYILVIYDIVDNRRRVAFAKKMNGYGFRVQKSAFEAMITENLYRKLLKNLEGRGISEEAFVKELCDIIMRHENFEPFTAEIKNKINKI